MTTQGRRRAFGQHFLRDTAIAHEIAATAISEGLRRGCAGFLEIGPGRGAITEPLLELLKEHQQKLLLVEKDRQLADYWQQSHHKDQLDVVSEDFLLVPQERWLKILPLAVVSNLPYSSGTQILIQLARQYEKIPVMVLMFQAEVAHRIRAEMSTPDRGSLSIWVQNRWDVTKVLAVKPSAFNPPPKVNSEVIMLTPRPQPRIEFPAQDEKLWESFLKSTFAHRRKMLRSSFPWQNALALSGVDGKKRAEALDWNEWNQLFQAVRQSP